MGHTICGKKEEKGKEENTNRDEKRMVSVALLGSCIHLVSGYNLAYSGIIVPQLLDEKNSTLIDDTSTWIVSSGALGFCFSGLISGLVIDRFGRINTLRFSLIPNLLGWVLVAISRSADTIIVGRFISGFALSFSSNSAMVYIAEISQPHIRAVLLTMPSMWVSIGVLLMFIQGRFLLWRWIAWLTVAYLIIISVLLFFVPESPAWSISKNRITQGRKSLSWFLGDDQVCMQTLVCQDLKNVMQAQDKVTFNTFKQPTVYKPFFIIIGLFAFQQLSGVLVIVSNIIILFMEIGIRYDLYSITIIIGVIRIVMSINNLWISKTFTRRTLLFTSGLGMTLSLSASALFSSWIQHRQSDKMWLPVLMVMIYLFFATLGLFAIPIAIVAELFPINVRGLMQSFLTSVNNLMSFVVLQSYRRLLNAFGGVVGLQYFYAIMCLWFVLYSFVYVPETYKKKLKDIQKYFWHHTTYLSS
ncbi:hypothetical protein FQR65_LT11330 [Abscondita terminalis]|nr:hypothetical protein FQR65_LT11330 [Abscondita terminalis]